MAEVTVYTTPTCPWCTKLKGYLNEKGIPFQEVNVAASPEAAGKLMNVSGQRSVPVTTVGDQVVVGFDPEGIDHLLGEVK
ncbi:MAG TPA: glutaredoxin family protein [Bacillota bacterium]|jgi:glutaredoxin-like YruB-family protein|nr:glutaredoxin family protein [Bacillota bacterium]